MAKEEIAHEEETREEPTRDDCSVEDTFKDEGLWNKQHTIKLNMPIFN